MIRCAEGFSVEVWCGCKPVVASFEVVGVCVDNDKDVIL